MDTDSLLDRNFLASLDPDIDVDQILAQFNQTPPKEDPPSTPPPSIREPQASPETPSWMRSPIVPCDTEIGKLIAGRTQNWVLGEVIAKSDKATVREARGQDGRQVAVKILSRHEASNLRDAERPDDEATIARHLSGHRNVLDFYDSAKTDDHTMIFMERAQEDLFQVIELTESGLDESKAREWFAQLVAAVSHCHRLGYVHTDLKPENALISSGVLKLSDFGSVQHISKASSNSIAEGTIQYAAPERFCDLVSPGFSHSKPTSPCSASMDVWSLGVILYTLVTKQFPFVEPSTRCRRYCRFIGGGDDSILEGLSEPLRKLIRGLLQPNPDERMTIEELSQHPWMVDGGTAVTQPANLTQQAAGACAEACRVEGYTDSLMCRTDTLVSCN